jgi:hypothetical protein
MGFLITGENLYLLSYININYYFKMNEITNHKRSQSMF